MKNPIYKWVDVHWPPDRPKRYQSMTRDGYHYEKRRLNVGRAFFGFRDLQHADEIMRASQQTYPYRLHELWEISTSRWYRVPDTGVLACHPVALSWTEAHTAWLAGDSLEAYGPPGIFFMSAHPDTILFDDFMFVRTVRVYPS